MKKYRNFKKRLAMCILGTIILNLITPITTVAFASVKNSSTIKLSIERRVLGQADILSSKEYKIQEGESASVSIDRIFKENKIQYKNTGTLEKNFYVSEIMTTEGYFLSEFDHGAYSGWKYSVNGIFPSVGFSEYKFKAGDVVRIQYTAKDMGQDILVVDKIFEIRDKLKEAEELLKGNYTEESINKLKSTIESIKKELPNDVQIGEMMSVELGNGDCDTYDYLKHLEQLMQNIKSAIAKLEDKPIKPEIPTINPEFEVNIFSDWDKINGDTTEQPNTIYLSEGQKSVGATIVRLADGNLPFLFDGVEVPVVDQKAVVEFTPGIHTLTVKRWGKPYEVTVVCKTVPYTVEGSLVPGGTATINFNGGIEEGLKNSSRYKLKETNVEYTTNIPGLKRVSSQVISGEEVDREILSKVTFKIPKDTEPGEYQLTEGKVAQTWEGSSYGSEAFKGKFSVLPNIKINISENLDLSNAYKINLNNWSKFDKVYTVDDDVTIIIDGISSDAEVVVNGSKISQVDDIYAVNMKVGNNKVVVDKVEYNIECKKISYSIENENKIIPGSEVTVQFKGIEKAFGYIEGVYNPNLVKTVFNTNISGLDKVESKEAGSSANINDEILNTITFKIPEDTEPGKYELNNGAVYQKWTGQNIQGKENGYFSVLPKVPFLVRDSIPEDTVPPQISTTLKEDLSVTKDKLSFSVIVTDNEDGKLKATVKLNGKIIDETSNDQYTVSLEEGQNTIEILALDYAGNKSSKTFVVKYEPTIREGASIILDTLSLVLNKGESHQIIAVDTPDSRTNETDDTAKMTYTVISGEDVIKVNSLGLVTAIKSGFAKISVRYPGLTNPAIVEVRVTDSKNENGPKINTTIKETKYDILYYLQDYYNYSFSVESEGSSITVLHDDKVIALTNGVYNIKLKEGYNPITIKASKDGKTTYETYNLRAKKLDINIENLTNKDKQIVEGDRVRISFTGLETPVPKFLRVFNPKRTRVEYKTDMPGATNIFGNASQYNIATNNSIEFTANNKGTFKFTGGNIEEQWWGDLLYSERDISNEGANTSAVVRQGNFSTLPDFEIEVKENKDYVNKIKVDILNQGDIKAGDEVTLKINNIEMPEVNKGTILQAYTVFNTNISGVEEIKSQDASTNYENLQTIKFKIPKDTKPGQYTITNGRVFKEWQPGVLYVDSEFYKGELPEIKIVITEEEKEEEGEGEVPPTDITKPVEVIKPSRELDVAINGAINWTLQNVKNPTFGDEWDIIGLIRSDLFDNKEYLEKYYKNLVQVVKDKKGNLSRNKYTEYSRTIIALTALGKDPKNVGGYDLVEKLYDYKKVSNQGINGIIFALIALDTNNYEIPKTATNSREKMINEILNSQLKDGGFALSGRVGDIDVTAMALQALAKYKDDDKVQASIDKALQFISKEQLSDGGFKTEGVKTLESSAQVLVALTALEIDIKSEAFVKNKNWIVSDIMNFIAKDGGFKHLLEQTEANDMATEQGLYGLVAYKRYLNKQTKLYDMSDVGLEDNEEGNQGNGNDNGDTEDNQGNGNNNGDTEGNQGNGNNNGDTEGNQGNGNNNGDTEGNQGNGNNNGDTEGNQGNGNNNGDTEGNQGNGNNNGDTEGNQGNGNNNGDTEGNQGNGNNNENTQGNTGNNSGNTIIQGTTNNKENQELQLQETSKNQENNITEELSNKEQQDTDEYKNKEDNMVIANKKELSNIQVVLLTLAVVFVVLALKEVIIIKYKKKRK